MAKNAQMAKAVISLRRLHFIVAFYLFLELGDGMLVSGQYR